MRGSSRRRRDAPTAEPEDPWRDFSKSCPLTKDRGRVHSGSRLGGLPPSFVYSFGSPGSVVVDDRLDPVDRIEVERLGHHQDLTQAGVVAPRLCERLVASAETADSALACSCLARVSPGFCDAHVAPSASSRSSSRSRLALIT